MCVSCANLLIGVGNTGNKQVSSFVNKMFKMADQYMLEYNNKLPANAAPSEKISRNLINRNFDAFKKKKESAQAEAAKASSRASQAM